MWRFDGGMRRSPYGERGLKYNKKQRQTPKRRSRSPYGERGLKYDSVEAELREILSLSLRRAWIEIRMARIDVVLVSVALLTESVD